VPGRPLISKCSRVRSPSGIVHIPMANLRVAAGRGDVELVGAAAS